MLHVIKLLVKRQQLITHVKVRMFNYCCFIVRDYVLVFVMFLACMLGSSVRNIVAGFKWIFCRGYGFVTLVSCRVPLVCYIEASYEYVSLTACYTGKEKSRRNDGR